MIMTQMESGRDQSSPPKLTVEMSCRGTFQHLKLTGALIGSSAVALQALMDQIGRSDRVTLDLVALAELDIVEFGALVTLDRQVQANGARLTVVSPKGRVAEVLLASLSRRPPETPSFSGGGWRSSDRRPLGLIAKSDEEPESPTEPGEANQRVEAA